MDELSPSNLLASTQSSSTKEVKLANVFECELNPSPGRHRHRANCSPTRPLESLDCGGTARFSAPKIELQYLFTTSNLLQHSTAYQKALTTNFE